MTDPLSRLEKSRTILSSELASVTDQDFHRTKDERSWSVAQVVEHLTLVDTGLGAEVMKALNSPSGRLNPLKELLPIQFIVALRFPKAKAPERAAPKSSGGKSRAELMDNLFKARESFKKPYLENDLGTMRGLVVRHPILGPLSAIKLLEFIAGHEWRHAKQVAEIRRVLAD